MEALSRSLRYAVRSLRSNAFFSLAIVITISLGVGASTGSFALTNWLLFHSVPGVHDARRLALVWFGARGQSGLITQYPVTSVQHAELTQGLTTLAYLPGYRRTDVSLTDHERAARVEAEFVMPSYFAALGTRPELGRLLVLEDDRLADGPLAAVIGYDLWVALFNRDDRILGRSLRVNTLLTTVVGVAPRGFHGVELNRLAELWLPGRAWLLMQEALGEPTAPQPFYSEFVARLAQGATFEQAESQLRVASERVIGQAPIFFRGAGIWPPVRAMAEDAAWLVVGVTTFLLLIACANSANLMLFRNMASWRRTAMRRVLGASTGELMCERLAEALLLAAPASMFGLLLGSWLVRTFRGLSLWRFGSPIPDLPFDQRVAVFAIGVSVVCALLASFIPTLLATRTAPMIAIQNSAGSFTKPSFPHRLFAASQVGLSLSLVVGVLLLAKTLRNLSGVQLGFDPDNVIAMFMAPVHQGHDERSRVAYYQQLVRRVREMAGVEAAALAFTFPMAPGGVYIMLPAVSPHADPSMPPMAVPANRVSPDYFRTLRIPLIAGRVFREDEFLVVRDDAPRVAVLSERLAKKLFGSQNPLGERLGPPPYYEVIGVVGDTYWRDLQRDRDPTASTGMLYVPFRGRATGMGVLLVRSNKPTSEAVAAVRAIAQRVDSSIPLYGETSLKDAVARNLSDRILLARLLALTSLLGVILAAVGLCALLAYGVTTQQREIGIRVALGASQLRIVASVLAVGLTIAVHGCVGGFAGGLIVARLLGSRLFGVAPLEPGAYLLAAVMVVGAATIGSAVPALVATRVDPMVALRVD